MTIETRVTRLERRTETQQVRVDEHDSKIDQVLQAVVDLHRDVRILDKRIVDLEQKLPDIIARAVAPLLARRDD